MVLGLFLWIQDGKELEFMVLTTRILLEQMLLKAVLGYLIKILLS